jgi:hypothetical protein
MHMTREARNINEWISYKILWSILCTIYTSIDPDCVKVSHHRHMRMRLRAAAHQLHQDMRQKTQSCFIHDSDSSPHTEVARVYVLSHLL